MARLFSRKSWLLAFLALVAMVLAACGGGEATSSPKPPASPTAARPSSPSPVATATAAPSPAPTGPQPKYGGTLKARYYVDWRDWDVYGAVHSPFLTASLQQVLSNLIRYKRDSISEIEGDLATSWALSGDGKTATFKLRQGVKWHDGKPFTAADVVYTLKRAGTDQKATFSKLRVAAVDTMETPDDLTVKVNLKQISLSFIPNMATAFMLIYPAHYPDIDRWNEAVIGTGGFTYKGYTKGSQWEFVRNPNYYEKDAAGRQLPYLDGVTYFPIADTALALGAFRTGRVHCGCTYDQDFLNGNIDVLRKEIPGLKFGNVLGAVHRLQFNLQRSPFSNLAFRQAIAIGIDKRKIASITFEGLGIGPVPLLIPPEQTGQFGLPLADLEKIPGFSKDYAADKALALKKLQESGLATARVEFQASTSYEPYQRFAEAIVTLLKQDLNVNAVLTPIASTGQSVQNQLQGNFDLVDQGNTMNIDDPNDNFSDFLVTGGPRNYGKYSNARVDELLAQQDKELDLAKRRAQLREVQQILYTEMPFVPIVWERNIKAVRPEVSGYVIGPLHVGSYYRINNVWLES